MFLVITARDGDIFVAYFMQSKLVAVSKKKQVPQCQRGAGDSMKGTIITDFTFISVFH